MWSAHLEGRRCLRGVVLLILAVLVPAAYFLDFIVVERSERESRWGLPRLAIRVGAGLRFASPAAEAETEAAWPAAEPGRRPRGPSCEGEGRGAGAGRDLPPPPARPSALFEWALANNERPLVLNEALFGSLRQNPPRHVIVVQVHTRIEYLRALLRSLSLVRGIESALLVLSHGAVDQGGAAAEAEGEGEGLLAAAAEACFCRVLRVFFPYSQQIWPDQFPGPDESCPQTRTSAAGGQDGEKTCPRNDKLAKLTMAKHHWWWLHNWVFNEIYPLANFTGEALFLEEDMLVSPDVLHVLDAMRRADAKADLLVLSDNSGGIDRDTAALAVRTRWVHNMGLAMGAAAWAKVARCAQLFCSYDDYNWDWSLQKVGEACVPGHFVVLVMRGARVFHVGKCGGLHFKASSACDSLLLEARAALAKAERDGVLFPGEVRAISKLDWPHVGRPNGSWADARDRQLCLDNANASLVATASQGLQGLQDIQDLQGPQRLEDPKGPLGPEMDGRRRRYRPRPRGGGPRP